MILGFWNEHSRRRRIPIHSSWRRRRRTPSAAGCVILPPRDASTSRSTRRSSRRRMPTSGSGRSTTSRGISVCRRAPGLGAELVCGLGDIDLPGCRLAMHLCKGNGTQSWIAEGGYDAFAESVFARATGFDAFLLEFDDDRSGSFEPLARSPGRQGCRARASSPPSGRTLEIRTTLCAGASRRRRGCHPRDRLAISTQCGFASASETASGAADHRRDPADEASARRRRRPPRLGRGMTNPLQAGRSTGTRSRSSAATSSGRSASSPSPTARSGRPTRAAASSASRRTARRSSSHRRSTRSSRTPVGRALHDERDASESASRSTATATS